MHRSAKEWPGARLALTWRGASSRAVATGVLALAVCAATFAAQPTPGDGATATLAQTQTPAQAQRPSGVNTPAVSTLDPASVVLRIMDYTQWPGERRPTLLCVTRGGAVGMALVLAVTSATPAPALAVMTIEPDRAPAANCDVVVIEGWRAAPMRDVLRALATRPVLTVGLGPEFCSDGGMACLSGVVGGVSFEVNTDAVARAGLRVNPRVLLLTRPRATS
jgi:YfiR/HmsC-like